MNNMHFILIIAAVVSLLIVLGASLDCEEEIKVKLPVVLCMWFITYLIASGLLLNIYILIPK